MPPTHANRARPVILLVDDDPQDQYLASRAFQASAAAPELHVVTAGSHAMAFLRQEAPFADRPRPDLVLMDLNMPDQLGTDVLAQIRSTPQLAKMPVVMQSASEREADVRASRAAGANAYFVKPITARDIPAVMGHIQDPIPKR
tara:strand:+ start:2086 stop:2517 length:432 start_codon:yes stop_codon:yes gene_type:complete